MAKEALKMNGSVSGTSPKTGFSLIELIVAIAIIGIMATIIMPRILNKPSNTLDTFIENVNLITRTGYEQAIITGNVHRIFFNMKAETPFIELQIEKHDKKSSTPREFIPVLIPYIRTKFAVPPTVNIKNFYIKGIDEATGGTLKDAWYYILPSGLSQEIIISISDTQKPIMRSLVLNPFTVKFSVYDTPQTP